MRLPPCGSPRWIAKSLTVEKRLQSRRLGDEIGVIVEQLEPMPTDVGANAISERPDRGLVQPRMIGQFVDLDMEFLIGGDVIDENSRLRYA